MWSLSMLYDAAEQERVRQRDSADRQRAAYVRRLAVARRRQRKADAAHRALALMVVR